MVPIMNARLNHTGFESQFEGARDALLHVTCTTAEYLGFKTSAWHDDVFERFNTAFSACADAELQPRFVAVHLIKAIDSGDPPDTVQALLEIIDGIIAAARAYKASGADTLIT